MSASSSLNDNYYSDIAVGRKLGSDLETADTEYRKAIKDGKQGDIAEAKTKRDKAEERFMSFMATKDKEHDIIMQIINMLRD